MKKILVMLLVLSLLSGCALIDYIEGKVKSGQDAVVEKTQEIGQKATDMFNTGLEKTKQEASSYINKKLEEVKTNINQKIDAQKEEIKEYIKAELLPDLKNYITAEIKTMINGYLEENNLTIDEGLSEDEQVNQYLKLIQENPQLQQMVVEEIESMVKE